MPDDASQSRALPSGRVKTGVALCALAGVALAVALVLYFGTAQVGDAFLAAGWQGLAAMTALYLASVTLCAFAWQILATTPPRNAVAVFHWARLLRDSVAGAFAWPRDCAVLSVACRRTSKAPAALLWADDR